MAYQDWLNSMKHSKIPGNKKIFHTFILALSALILFYTRDVMDLGLSVRHSKAK